MNLTDEEIRIKVAEAHGTMRWSYALPTKCIGASVPNYPEDLNACAEFEAKLTDKEWDVYSAEIVSLTLWDRATDTVKRILQATARQRCLAYLKTKGILP